MPEIQFPDGAVAWFPDEMSDAEIKAEVRKEFPPATLKPGEVEIVGGAAIAYDVERRRYAVVDAGGTVHGWRADLDKARELAMNVPEPPDFTPPAPPMPSRSPNALPLPPPPGVPGGIPKDVRMSLFPGPEMSPWRRRSGLPASPVAIVRRR